MFDRVAKAVNNEPTNIPRTLLSETGWKLRYKDVKAVAPDLERYKDWHKVLPGPGVPR